MLIYVNLLQSYLTQSLYLNSCVDPSFLIEMLGLDASQQQDAQEFSKLFIDLLPCPQIKSLFSGSYDYVTK